MKKESNLLAYDIGKKVRETTGYRLYVCIQKESGRQCLLQIATEVTQNGNIDRFAYIITELKRRSDEIEEEYSRVKTDPESVLNYHLGFPELVESFFNHDGRRVNILAFRSVDEISGMVPLINITKKDLRRVDPRTSAWIMGKLLKLLVFVHGEGISIETINGNNILIEPDKRYVLVFDWLFAKVHFPNPVPFETRCREISQAAKVVIAVLGGYFRKRIFPDDGNGDYARYFEYLMRLASGNESNAKRAHAEFYKIVDSFWKKEFYPFTTIRLK